MQISDSKAGTGFTTEGTCVTVGTFDGVHLGHSEILRFLKSVSIQNKLDSVVFTFGTHPRFVLKSDSSDLKILSTPDEKAQLISRFGIDYLYVQDFTPEFSSMQAEKFISEILVGKLKMKSLVVGHDHLFGKDRIGNFALLSELSDKYGFSLIQIPAISNSGFNISSTKIRNLLSSADIQMANDMLGYNYSFTGDVIKGFGIGRELGFPTANLKLQDPQKILPAPGVYIIKAMHDSESFEGIINIGSRPTFEGSGMHIEAHLFDFDKIVYDDQLTIEFLLFLREEIKFNSREELVSQIRKDRDRAFKYFGRIC
ncbi:MAG: riboflavin biosynthesis protein RibF [Bacteroidetes bacterium GWF2_43_63]|nr:MAG: riboflavin biosynthesis protein RibF [Bacteroidetes bacterium GWE2_42_42]OFY54703.1 MAG: riboflavin biosynthesis protein RibF [Bacteroidetes bacterium GWF2_43_63]HBG69700.1 riboflavin biosynthesis protein RibF [Bacteroidales bacterium]HCB63141.1 riboflavin biosynthesis protein RibF [Bacteroidales bacterium]HCY22164.1 riboflavin biosynthesis protein RibF [Bacteroidales bacterium]